MPSINPPGGNLKSSGQLDERVDAWHPRSPLKQADLGSVKRGTRAELFLAEVGSPACLAEVRTESPRNL